MNTISKFSIAAIATAAVVLGTGKAARAASLSQEIDVLWYGQHRIYNAKMSEIAEKASSFDPAGDGSLDWNLTIWDPSDPAPNFSDYDVFVIGNGFTEARYFGFDASGILNNKDAISAARGNRTFLSGQDADLHYILNVGPRLDGPLGFLVNAVNWAASGTGMGIVSLPDGYRKLNGQLVGQWWLDENSFLKDELEGYVSYIYDESVIIPTATSDFPVNEGLTTAGLSNWRLSAHLGFNKDIPGYISINDAGSELNTDKVITIVTGSEADGCTNNCTPDKDNVKVPEPSSVLGLFAFGAVGAGSLLKRKLQKKASLRA